MQQRKKIDVFNNRFSDFLMLIEKKIILDSDLFFKKQYITKNSVGNSLVFLLPDELHRYIKNSEFEMDIDVLKQFLKEIYEISFDYSIVLDGKVVEVIPIILRNYTIPQ